MSTSSNISLGALRLQAQQRSDCENNPFITTPEWNNMITNSHKELYDMLIGAYGNEYHIANAYQFSLGNGNFYSLPDGTANFLDVTGATAAKYYKLSGVDLQYSSSPTGWVTLRRFEWIERNKYSNPNISVNITGYTSLRYCPRGSGIYFAPTPAGNQLIQAWYYPAPVSLQIILAPILASSTTVTVADVTGLVVGMSVSGTGIPSNTTIATINTGANTFTISNAATITGPSTVQCWLDSTTIDGIAGWEEYVIVDAAIKAQIKQQKPIAELKDQKNDLKKRIEAMAEGRDASQAHHVSDVLGANGGSNSDVGDGNGGGCGWGGV